MCAVVGFAFICWVVVDAERREGLVKETWRFGRGTRRRGEADEELSFAWGRREEGAVVW